LLYINITTKCISLFSHGSVFVWACLGI